jgi:hypothetical protein
MTGAFEELRKLTSRTPMIIAATNPDTIANLKLLKRPGLEAFSPGVCIGAI